MLYEKQKIPKLNFGAETLFQRIEPRPLVFQDERALFAQRSAAKKREWKMSSEDESAQMNIEI